MEPFQGSHLTPFLLSIIDGTALRYRIEIKSRNIGDVPSLLIRDTIQKVEPLRGSTPVEPDQ